MLLSYRTCFAAFARLRPSKKKAPIVAMAATAPQMAIPVIAMGVMVAPADGGSVAGRETDPPSSEGEEAEFFDEIPSEGRILTLPFTGFWNGFWNVEVQVFAVVPQASYCLLQHHSTTYQSRSYWAHTWWGCILVPEASQKA